MLSKKEVLTSIKGKQLVFYVLDSGQCFIFEYSFGSDFIDIIVDVGDDLIKVNRSYTKGYREGLSKDFYISLNHISQILPF